MIILYNNVIPSANALTVTSQTGDLGADNLKTYNKADVWRSGGLTASINASFSSNLINCVSLAVTSLSSVATIRVICGSVDTGDVAVVGYSMLDKVDFGTGSLNANAFNYGGGNYATITFDPQTTNTISIEIKDPLNNLSYFDISSAVVGYAFTPTFNADYGAELKFNDNSVHTRTDAGNMVVEKGTRHKQLSFSLSNMVDADREFISEMFVGNGATVPVFVSLMDGFTNPQAQQAYQIYGFIKSGLNINRVSYGRDNSSIEIEEI